MNSAVHRLSKEMGIKENELVIAGAKAYIKSELGKIETKLHALYYKYGIKSIKDLERAIVKGDVVESDVLDDLTKIDYLESEKIKLEKLMRTV